MATSPPIHQAMLEHPIFAGVEASVVRAIAKAGAISEHRRQQTLLREGEPPRFFVLLKGAVKVVYTSPNGSEVVVKIFRAPAVFGEMECLASITTLESVVTLQGTRVLEVAAADFLAALAQSPRLTRHLLDDLAKRLCIAAHQERLLAFGSVEARLASLMLSLLEGFGVETKDGVEIAVQLSQDDLARSLGTARRSVTRVLQKWARTSLLGKRGKHYVVRDPSVLQRMRTEPLLGVGYQSGQALTLGNES